MFSIHIGNRLFRVGDEKSLADAVNCMLSSDVQKVEVKLKEADPNVFVGGASRLIAGKIEPLIKVPHVATKVVDQQNDSGVSDESIIVYSANNF